MAGDDLNGNGDVGKEGAVQKADGDESGDAYAGLDNVLERYGINNTGAVAVLVEHEEEEFEEEERSPGTDAPRNGLGTGNGSNAPSCVPLATSVAVEEHKDGRLGVWAMGRKARLLVAALLIAALAAAVTAGVLVSRDGSTNGSSQTLDDVTEPGEGGPEQEEQEGPEEESSDGDPNMIPDLSPSPSPTAAKVPKTGAPPTGQSEDAASPPGEEHSDLPRWNQIGPDLLGQEGDELGYVALADGADAQNGEAPSVILAVGNGRGQLDLVRMYQIPLNGGTDKSDNQGGSTNATNNEGIVSSTNSLISSWNWTEMQIGADIIDPGGRGPLSSGFGADPQLSADGTIIAQGAGFSKLFRGSAYVLKYDPGAPGQWAGMGRQRQDGMRGEILPDEDEFVQLFGAAVSLSGDGSRLGVIGTGALETSFLRVYDLSEDGSKWVQAVPDVTLGDGVHFLDLAASEDGKIFAIRTAGEVLSGRVLRLIERQPGDENFKGTNETHSHWTQLGEDIPMERAGYNMGFVDLSADGLTVAMSDYTTFEQTGLVHVYRFDPTTDKWNRMGGNNLTEADDSLLRGDEPGDQFGWCLSFSQDGNRLAAGAPLHKKGSGLVRVLDWKAGPGAGANGIGEDGAWVLASEDIVGKMAEGFGESIGRSCSLANGGNLLAVGSVSGNKKNTGISRVFQLNL
mmetsp:Transcript_6285/g.18451  ORF Transcript_6285/g.18451 Transcript_6285/m.18451 type:complete len:682 (-) Transcript_6285:33-2078(-)